MLYIKVAPFYIESLYSYSKYLSRLFKTIDPTANHDLKERIEFNNELEKKLQQHGNDESVLSNHNPKPILLQIANLLTDENRKSEKLFEIINEHIARQIPTLLIANNNDIEFINENIKFYRSNFLQTIRYSKLERFIKENDPKNFYIIDTSLEGYNDFLRYYNYDFTVNLLLYPQENEIYKSYQRKYQKELEEELASAFREEFTGLKYQSIPKTRSEKPLSSTIQEIINNANEYGDEDDFKAIKENPELDRPDAIHYIVEYEDLELYRDELDSSDYVFNAQNKLVRIGRVNLGDRIRVYNEKLNVSLFDIAAEEDEETFNLIEH